MNLNYANNATTLVRQLDRLDIRAPVGGIVYGLQVFGSRAVIRPADPLLFIVPQDRPLVIATQVAPTDIDVLTVGQEVSVRFLDRPLAHRALHDATMAENSLEAVKAAVDAGYGIEIDIQPSKDGVPMVFHDYDLARLTGVAGPIAQATSLGLSCIPLSGGGTIPTLAQVLEVVAGQVPLLIEIKDQDGALGPQVGPLENAVCNALKGYEGDVALMSFNANSVAACRDFAPNIPRGITTCSYPAEDWPLIPKATRYAQARIPDFDRVGACFISHQQDDLASPHVIKLQDRGVPILCWTVRSPETEVRARKIADNITFEGYRP
ncbi:Type I secretion system membrane fusion protein PrsE [Nymphon striatum]|nr:Type I secretion system membrane fusion protein PrsE [Nymphon striatum]